jgi:hypothetical protein
MPLASVMLLIAYWRFMGTNGRVLQGTHIRLELLEHRHVDGLAAASAIDPSLYQPNYQAQCRAG